MNNEERLKYQKKIEDNSIPEPNSGCWLWEKGLSSGRCGSVRAENVTWKASRLSYTAFKGDIPSGLLVRHTCDNELCVNPEHLLLGTQYDNMRDCYSRGRQSSVRAKGELSGHSKLSNELVLFIRAYKGNVGWLCKFLGISNTSYNDVKRGRSWKHV